MSKKSIIALIIVIVLLFAAGISVGVFLYTRGTAQASGDDEEIVKENPEDFNENPIEDENQLNDDNENTTVPNENDNEENVTNTDEQNNNAGNNDEENEQTGENEVTTGTNVNDVGETTVTRYENQDKISRTYWDWWKPLEFDIEKSDVGVNQPQLSVKKMAITGVGGDEFIYAGQDITYYIAVSNNGDTNVEDIEITDKIPQNTTFVSIQDATIDNEIVGTKTTVETENTVVGVKWTVSIPAQKTVIVKFTVNVNKTMLDENQNEVETTGVIANTAIANGEESTDPTNDPEEGNETKTSIIKANKTSIITRNDEEVEVAKVGDLITYTITVENTGDAEGTTYIQDKVPEGTEFVSAQEGAIVSEAKDSVVWSIVLGAKETATRTFTVKVISVDGTIENIADVGGKETNTDVTETGNIDIEKTVSQIITIGSNGETIAIKGEELEKYKAKVGDVIEYTIVVTNTGSLDLEDVVVDEKLPGININEKDLKIGYLLSGESEEIKATYIITYNNDIQNNPNKIVHNKVEVEGVTVPKDPEKEPEKVNDEDDTETPVENISYTTEITVNKIWEDENKTENRPKEIIVILKDDNNNIIQEKNISGKTNIWTYTFKNIPKYDENGEEIKYSVDEREAQKGDLDLYEKSIKGTTIVNTLKQPKIEATKTGSTNTGKDVVQIGDKIKYTIKITNNGNLGKEIKIGDQIPENTKLIGNIQLNGKNLTEEQEKDFYNNNLKKYIAEKQTIEIIFEVQVISGNAGQKIINIAKVDDKDVGPVINPIEKIVEVTKYKNNIGSTNIVLVLDVSSSMTRYPHNEYDAPVGKRRIDIAKKALIDFINKTYQVEKNKDVTFSLITFSNREDTKLFKFNENEFIATKKTQKDFIEAIEKIKTGHGTNIRAGLEYAYDSLYGKNGIKNIDKYKQYDSILIFFGDGEPYGESHINNAKGIKEEADKIRNNGTKLYSIGFGPDVKPGQTGYDILSIISNDKKVYNSESYENLVDDFSKIIGADPIYNQITIDGTAIIKLQEKQQEIVVDKNNPIIIKINGKEIKITSQEEALQNNIKYNKKELLWDVSNYEEASKLEISYHVE